jgi:hypothetical protein
MTRNANNAFVFYLVLLLFLAVALVNCFAKR